MKVEYAIEYIGRYVALLDKEAADGYCYDTLGKAIRFPKDTDALAFVTVIGPHWLTDMYQRGLIEIRIIHDGVPQGTLARKARA